MKIFSINKKFEYSNFQQQNFKGKINYSAIKNELNEIHKKELDALNKKIAKESFNINISQTVFGDYITQIYDTKNNIMLKPLSFQPYRHSVPEFIESLISLINFKNND